MTARTEFQARRRRGRKMSAAGARAALTAGALLLAGCIKVGPDYAKPDLPLPAQWSAELPAPAASAAAQDETLSRWWTVFSDPVLTDLIGRAQAGNLDLRQAEARVRQARAERNLARAAFYPTLSAGLSGRRSRSSEQMGMGGTQSLFSAGFDAAWEIDLFGKTSRAVEAAGAALEASEELRA